MGNYKGEKAELKVMVFDLIHDGKRIAAMVVLALLQSKEFHGHMTLAGVCIDFQSDTIPNFLTGGKTGVATPNPTQQATDSI